MKLKTSFFDKTVFRKDIRRYAPLWGLYFIGGMMVMLTVTDSVFVRYSADYVGQTIGLLSVANLIYACLVAQLLFGDLFNARLCNALHAMPLRREGWFFTHLAAGVCYSLVPNAVGIFLLMFRMGEFWYVGLLWLLGMTLHYLFFFGLAVFSMFCTGKRFAAVAVYGILNFASMIALWFCDTIYAPLMYGVEISYEPFNLLCPVVQIWTAGDYVLWQRTDGYQQVFVGLSGAWSYLAAVAAVGIVLLAVSLVMYRRRKLESAGDFIAVKPLGPVFAVVFTLCAGAVFAMFGQLAGGDYAPYLILGMLVGWFVAQMLLQRTVKVFRPKAFAKAGVLIGLMFLSVLLVQVDAFNIVGWVPKAEEVKSVTLTNYKKDVYAYDYFGNRVTLKLTEQEDIEKILRAHEDILSRKEQKVEKGHRVVLTYELKNGRTVQRNYWAPADGENFDIIHDFYNSPEIVFNYTDWTEFVEYVQTIYLHSDAIPSHTIRDNMLREVLEALKADCEAGYVGLVETKETVCSMVFDWNDGKNGYYSRTLRVYNGAENTLALLKDPRIIMGYTYWGEFLEGIEYILVAGENLDLNKKAEFLLALCEDCENGEVWLNDTDGEYCTKVEYLSQVKSGQYVQRGLYVGKNATETVTWLKEHMPESMIQ